MSKVKRSKKEIPHTARGLIRHAYDQVVTHTARLASFSASPPLPNGGGAIEKRQNALAIDDLLALALHVRRLIDISGLAGKVGKTTVTGLIEKAPCEIPIVQVVNTIIHNSHIDIMRRKSGAVDPRDIALWLERHKQGILPIVVTKSEREKGYIVFRLDFLISAIINGIIEPVVEHCDARGLYLEDDNLLD